MTATGFARAAAAAAYVCRGATCLAPVTDPDEFGRPLSWVRICENGGRPPKRTCDGGTMLTLYQVEWCPSCHRVRQVMTELGLTYLTVNVQAERNERADVLAVSDQTSVPTLQDGDKVFSDSDEILEYLRGTYPAPENAGRHAAAGAWRAAVALSLAPRAALRRLKQVLEEKGFKIVAQVRGQTISELLPKEYVLLEVAVPVAAVKAVDIDPLAPAAVLLPMAVMPAESGGSVVATADPVGQVWLYGEPPLTRIQAAVKKRLAEVLEEL